MGLTTRVSFSCVPRCKVRFGIGAWHLKVGHGLDLGLTLRKNCGFQPYPVCSLQVNDRPPSMQSTVCSHFDFLYRELICADLYFYCVASYPDHKVSFSILFIKSYTQIQHISVIQQTEYFWCVRSINSNSGLGVI